MPIGHMFDNFVGPWNQNNPVGNINYGMAFAPQADGTINKVGWWRNGGGGIYAIDRLQLWRVSDQALLWEELNPVDSGVQGWQWTTVSPNIAVLEGVEYVAAYGHTNGQGHAYIAGASMPSYGTGLNKPTNFRRYVSGGYTFPANADPTFAEQVDVEYESGAIPPIEDDPVTSLALENALTRWFDSGVDNTRTAELPWMIKTVVDTIAATQATHTGAIAGVAPTVMGSGGPTLAALAAEVATAVGLTAVGASVEALMNSLLDTPTSPDNAGVIVENIRQSQLLSVGAANSPVAGSGWTFQDTLTGMGSVQWVSPADAFTFTMLDIGSSLRFSQTVGIGTLINWRGWAKPWDGTFWYPEQVQVNGPDCVLRSGGRWPGVGMWVPPDVEWELKAYIYTG